jgi:signal peptidase II
MLRTRLLLLLLIVTTIGCDRVTKHVATTTLAGAPTRSFMSDAVRLMYAENAGGFLGVGADLPLPARTIVFTIGTSLLLVAGIAAAVRLNLTGWPLLGLGLASAGAASNLLDRIVRGTVIDFLNLGIGPLRTGIFNIADVAVVVGLGVLVITYRELHRGDTPDASTRVPASLDPE